MQRPQKQGNFGESVINNIPLQSSHRIPQSNAVQKFAPKQAKPSFCGIYGLRGTLSEIEQATALMQKQKIDFNIMDFLNEGSRKVVGVLTNDDKKDFGMAKDKLQNTPKSITNLEEIFDTSKIMYFNFNFGGKNEIKKFQKDNLEIYANIVTNSRGVIEDVNSRLRSINFAKPMNLKDSLEKLLSLRAESGFAKNLGFEGEGFRFVIDRFGSFLDYNQELKTCDDFLGHKILGMKGYGGYSIAFHSEENDVFKMSFEPNTPEIPAGYDMPVIRREAVKLVNPQGQNTYRGHIFCVLQENGKSWVENKITFDDEVRLLKKIQDSNGKTTDFGAHQIAKVDDEPFLVDSQCILNRELWGSDLKCSDI